jgi:murein DD-endopeptidase MepM/ murein hydrolase activator NlpD
MKLLYRYNEETCRYEPIVVSPRLFLKNIFQFLGISFLLGLGGVTYYNSQYPLLDEVQKVEENAKLKTEWQAIHAQLKKASQLLTELESNDDHNFRVILDMDPLSSTQREAGVGGREKASAEIAYPIIRSAIDFSEKIKNRLTVEVQSINELKSALASKQKQWAARPAIQPINNKQLIHLYLVFGERLHPLLGYTRPHNGLDFASPARSPIYATGDGMVTYANGGTTYGNAVFINHGYGFETRYGHMSQFIVSVGQSVKRGQILGYVGSTGLSGGNHLHYEVMYHGKFVNPIGFFQRDLNNSEYEKLIALGKQDDRPLD